MAKTCVIYVVRHGQSVHNRDGIISGHVDPALTAMGKRQAEEAKRKLADVHFDAIYSSDLQRAAHTAEIIAGRPVLGTNRLGGLRERSYGSLDGGPRENLQQLREDQRAVYESLSLEQRWRFSLAPDMESDHQVSRRFMDALEEIVDHNLGKTILVAAHGGTFHIEQVVGVAKLEVPSK